MVFNVKFFYGEAKFSLALLGLTHNFFGKDLALFAERFHERALDYYDAVDEETMVDVYLPGMANDYRVFFENLMVPSSSKLMEAGGYQESKQICQKDAEIKPCKSSQSSSEGHFPERGQ